MLKLEEMSYTDIDQLDRRKTIFFLTFGIMEEHGPHLPVGADYFGDLTGRDELVAHLLAKHPDYDFVLVPPLPLGEAGANDIAGQFEHLGSFTVRFETLRSVAIDLGASIARKGFQNIFVLAGHGMALHNEAINQAADFVSERYGVRMVPLSSLVEGERDYVGERGHVEYADTDWNEKVLEKNLGKGWSQGYDAHAGVGETSMMLFLRPDLVKPSYRDLPPFEVKQMEDARGRTDWQGYWGDPAKSTAEIGRQLFDAEMTRVIKYAEMALRGEDLSKLPRWPDPSRVEMAEEQAMERELYATQAREFERWLARYTSKNK